MAVKTRAKKKPIKQPAAIQDKNREAWLDAMAAESHAKQVRLHLEKRYAESVVGITRGKVVRWKWGPGRRSTFTGILHGFRVTNGGEMIFCIVELIRKKDGSRCGKHADYLFDSESEWKDCTDDFPGFEIKHLN